MLWSINLRKLQKLFRWTMASINGQNVWAKGFQTTYPTQLPSKNNPPQKKMANLSQPLFKKTWIGNDPFSHNHGFFREKIGKFSNSTYLSVTTRIVSFFGKEPQPKRAKKPSPFSKIHKVWDPTRLFFSNFNDWFSIEATGAWNWKLGKVLLPEVSFDGDNRWLCTNGLYRLYRLYTLIDYTPES